MPATGCGFSHVRGMLVDLAEITRIDKQIKTASDKRADAIDRLVNALIEIDTVTTRINALLDRRNLERNAETPGRMA